MARRGTNQPFTNGISELLVLSLISRGEMYGYEIVREIGARTGEVIALGEGSIYPSLHALEAAGCLRSRSVEHRGRPRVYYKITAKGRRRLQELGRRWLSVNEAISSFLGDSDVEFQPA